MKLSWYGHSCFLLETEQGSVVFDPYEPGFVPGLELPKLNADLCLCSHGHGDHNYAAAVELSGRTPEFKVEKIEVFHDDKQGMLRGNNTMHLIETEGRRVLHMGDLGHSLDKEMLERLGHIDLLLIPVGGYYTIDAATACRIVREMEPDIVVPMHYRGQGFGLDAISTEDDFVQRMDRVKMLDSNVLSPDWALAPITFVLRCPAAED